jgi:peptide/nickel transport system permease protein
MLGLVMILLIVFGAIFAPWLPLPDPNAQNYDELFSPPSLKHPLGTDQYGRDIFSRILHGSKYALLIGVVVVAIEVIIGVTLGLFAGYYGGLTETLIMRMTDVMLSIPAMVLALAIAGFLGGGLRNVIIAVGVIGWRGYARLIRSEVLSVREETFVEAAEASGCNDAYIMRRHILPNTFSSFLVYTTLQIPSAILWAAGLSFLGLGAQPPTPEWGAMLAGGRDFIRQAWWITTFPGLAIMVTVLSFNFLGDGLRDLLDPRTKSRMEGA